MLNIFNIPLRLIKQIQANPYFGAGFFAFIFAHIIVLSFLQVFLGCINLSLISENYAFLSFLFFGLLTFTSSYLMACVLDHIITKHQINKAFNSSCTGFIATLFFVYSLDKKMKLSFKKQVLYFEIDETKLSASDRHKFKEYQILSKYLSSQHFYKALDDADRSLVYQWREQCRRFEGKDGDLSAHWIQSTEELLKILIPHKQNIIDIAKNIEFYKAKKNDGAQLILQKIKESFDQLA
jgi:hypothetical protein